VGCENFYGEVEVFLFIERVGSVQENWCEEFFSKYYSHLRFL